MRKCYYSKCYKGIGSAGNKAKTDIEKIMEASGFVNVGLQRVVSENAVKSFVITLFSVLKTLFSLTKGDLLIIQYPLKKYFAFSCRIAHFRGCKVVALIHDLGSFRRKKLSADKEIKRLGNSDYVIAHNQIMASWLKENGCKTPVGCLGVFDYLSDVDNKSEKRENADELYRVLYAGSISKKKTAFLYQMVDCISSYQFNLYGGGFDMDISQNELFAYKGFIGSDELIATASGDFGLVWDGDSIMTCSGVTGEYLRYNNPHKASFYIRCHLPIIIWNNAALADFVRENKIGICVDSMEDLNSVLASLSAEDYQAMKRNTIAVSRRLSKGYYFKKAISDAERVLKGSKV